MSRQYSNRPYVPSRSHISLQMCDFVPYSASQTNDTSSDSSSWQLTDPLSCMHQQQQQPPLPPPPPPQQQQQPSTSSSSTPNDFSYFQYPPHRHTLESPLIAPNREVASNPPTHPPCHFHYLDSTTVEPPRPLLPLSLVTV